MSKKQRPKLDAAAAADLYTPTTDTSAGAEGEKVNPLGVKLDQADIDRLNEIAQELSLSRHILMIYAIRDFIRRYDAGERPRTKTETVTKLDL